MKVVWWQGGVHFRPESQEDVDALRGMLLLRGVEHFEQRRRRVTEVRPGPAHLVDLARIITGLRTLAFRSPRTIRPAWVSGS